MTIKDDNAIKINGISQQLSTILSFILESSNDTCAIVNNKFNIDGIK